MASVLVKALVENSLIISAVESRDLVNKVIKIHNLSPMGAAALGRALTMASLMGAELKNADDYLTAIIKGNGPLGTITVCADGKGHVKGTVQNPVVETVVREDGHLDVGAAVGKQGQLTVIKDIGLKQPYVGTSQLVNGEIAADFAYYFATSEQQPCGVTLGVGLQNGKCKSAGGVFVQVLPNCDGKLLEQVEAVMYAMDEMSYQFENNTARQVIEKFFGSFSPVFTSERPVTYKCNCSKRKIDGIVRGLGKEEAQSIIDDVGKIEVCCHFCGKKYVYTQSDADKLFEK